VLLKVPRTLPTALFCFHCFVALLLLLAEAAALPQVQQEGQYCNAPTASGLLFKCMPPITSAMLMAMRSHLLERSLLMHLA
jgi:hypothetical protein